MRIPELAPNRPPRVVVVGDLILDRYLWGSCDRISPEAPVQVVNIKRVSDVLGGAANVVANLRAFGAEAVLICAVGDDEEASTAARLLDERGATTKGLITDRDRPTTLKTRVMAVAQQIVRLDRERSSPVDDQVTRSLQDTLDAELACGVDALVLSDYGKGVLTGALTRYAIAACRARGVPVLVDPKGNDYSKYHGATLITPNRKEAAAAVGFALDEAEQVRSAGQQLMARHALDACLITLSEHGMALFEGDREARLPTEAREVFDVTGAGDTVIAAVAFGMATGLPIVDACRFANRAAGIAVGKVGVATVTLDEVRRADPAHGARLAEKILTCDELVARLAKVRPAAKVVFTNGCFDILHAGHVQYLARARTLGDLLVVGLNSDASVRRLKGSGRPVNQELDRAAVLAALGAVDFVVLFHDDTPQALIEAVVPDVLVKGGDYRAEDVVGGDVVRRAGGQVEILPFLDGRSTTRVISAIRGSEAG